MKLTLRRSQCEPGQLPPFCMRCGVPATAAKEKRFVWRSQSDLLLALLLLIVCFPVGLFLWILPTKRRRVHVPLCNKHASHWLWRRVIFIGILATYAFILAVELYPIVSTEQKLEGVHLFLFLAAWLSLNFFPLTWTFVSTGSLQASSITKDELTLDGVSKEFVRLVKMNAG